MGGLETGIVGAVWMLAVFVVDAAVRGRHWYMMPNLWASLFYGAGVFRSGPGRVTLVGVALHLFQAGLIGAFYALLFSQLVNLFRAALVALIVSVFWYWCLYSESALRWSPLPAGYKTASAAVAHLLFGVFLLRSRTRVRALMAQFSDAGVAVHPVPRPETDPLAEVSGPDPPYRGVN